MFLKVSDCFGFPDKQVLYNKLEGFTMEELFFRQTCLLLLLFYRLQTWQSPWINGFTREPSPPAMTLTCWQGLLKAWSFWLVSLLVKFSCLIQWNMKSTSFLMKRYMMSCTIYYSDQKLLFAEMDTRIFQFQSHFKFFL